MSPCHESESTFSFCYIKINVKFQSPFYSFLVIFTSSFYPRTNRGKDRQIKHTVHFLFNKTPTGTILLLIFTYLFHIPHAVLLRLFAFLLLFFFFGWQQQCTSSFVTCCWNLGGLPNGNCEKLQYGQTSTAHVQFYVLWITRPATKSDPIVFFTYLLNQYCWRVIVFFDFLFKLTFQGRRSAPNQHFICWRSRVYLQKKKLTKWIGNSIWHTCISTTIRYTTLHAK